MGISVFNAPFLHQFAYVSESDTPSLYPSNFGELSDKTSKDFSPVLHLYLADTNHVKVVASLRPPPLRRPGAEKRGKPTEKSSEAKERRGQKYEPKSVWFSGKRRLFIESRNNSVKNMSIASRDSSDI